MTIYHTAYDTTQCEGFGPGVNKTQQQMQAAIAMGALIYASPDMLLVYDGDNYRNAIAGFTHPMRVSNKPSQEKGDRQALAIDVRPFGSWSRNQNKFVVRDESQMIMALLRLRLSSIWLTEERSYLRNVSPIPIKMFASWIMESLANKFALEPLERMNVSILAGVLYLSNFSDTTELDENERTRLAASLSRDLAIDVKEILPVVDQYPSLAGVDAFCKAASAMCGVRLAELNRGLLYASLGGSWFGYNFKEVLAVALEHPPTWLAIVYTAGTDRSYRNTRLFKTFENNSRGGTDDLFKNSLKRLVDNLAPLTTADL